MRRQAKKYVDMHFNTMAYCMDQLITMKNLRKVEYVWSKQLVISGCRRHKRAVQGIHEIVVKIGRANFAQRAALKRAAKNGCNDIHHMPIIVHSFYKGGRCARTKAS